MKLELDSLTGNLPSRLRMPFPSPNAESAPVSPAMMDRHDPGPAMIKVWATLLRILQAWSSPRRHSWSAAPASPAYAETSAPPASTGTESTAPAAPYGYGPGNYPMGPGAGYGYGSGSGMKYGFGMGPGMLYGWGYGGGMGVLGGLWMILVWGIPTLLLFRLGKYLFGRYGNGHGQPSPPAGKGALDSLKETYARGEMERDEYLRKREDLLEK